MKGRVKWDEAKLAEIEATKPIRQKIAEPKTPYHPMLGEDGSLSPAQYVVGSIGYAADAEALRNALNKVVSSQKHCASLGGWTSSDDEADATEQQEASIMVQRGMSFKDHGKEHSDEFWTVKELKKKGCLLGNENDAGRGPLSSLLSFRVREIHIDGPDEILPK